MRPSMYPGVGRLLLDCFSFDISPTKMNVTWTKSLDKRAFICFSCPGTNSHLAVGTQTAYIMRPAMYVGTISNELGVGTEWKYQKGHECDTYTYLLFS